MTSSPGRCSSRMHNAGQLLVFYKLSVKLIKTSFRGVDDARETYERLVSVFPTSGRYWKTYIEQEVRKYNMDMMVKR